MRARLLSLFSIRPGEGQLVLLVLAYAILLYVANVLARTASYALFLTEFDAQLLPYAYVGISIVAPLVSAVYLRLNGRFSLSTVLIVVHAFLFLTLAGYRLGLAATSAPWLLFSLPIYFGVNNSLTISSFWNLLGRIYDLQQGKRLFGLLSSGEHLATVLTGFMAPLLVDWLGTPNLFVVAAVVMVAAMGVLAYVTRIKAEALGRSEDESAEQRRGLGADLLKDGYIRLIMALFALFIVGVYFVDNIFYSQAEQQFATQDSLASFIGVFFALVGGLSLLIQAFGAGRALSRFGVQAMILATPIGVLIIMVPFALTGLLTESTAALFWLAAAANLYRLILDAVDSAAVNIMYQPLPRRARTQAQTTVIGVVYPVSIGLTGLVLLLLTQVLRLDPAGLAIVLLPVLLLWLATGISLGRTYPRQLQRALRHRVLGGISMPRPDRSSLTIFQQALASDYVGAVVYALDMLEEIDPAIAASVLPDLLSHSSPEVRMEALARIEKRNMTSALASIKQRLMVERVAAVRSAGLRAMAVLSGSEIPGEVLLALEDDDPLVRDGALVGLLRNERTGIVALARERLAGMANSQDPAERVRAAQAIAEVKDEVLKPLLIRLLEDEHNEVRRAALVAAGSCRFPDLWAQIIAELNRRQTRGAAVAALVAGGDTVLPHIEAAVLRPGQDRQVLARLAQMCGRIGGPVAISLLLRHVDHPDSLIRTRVLASLRRSGYRTSADEQPLIGHRITAEVRECVQTLAALVDIGQAESVSLLTDSLRSHLADQKANVFRLLSFIYDPDVIWSAWEALRPPQRGDAERRAYAAEALEIALPRELKPVVMPLVRDLNEKERVTQLQAIFPQQALGRPGRLLVLVEGARGQIEPWIRACAIYGLVRLNADDALIAQSISSVLQNYGGDPLVAETAGWALAQMNNESAAQALLEQVRERGSPAPGALLTVERVSALKHVAIFSEIPYEVLADMAPLMTEVRLPAGRRLFRKGDRGESLFVIVSGRVRVHDGDYTLNHLGPGQVFGEMALLDVEPRVASVTAADDTLLLELDQRSFYELIAEQPAVIRGVIRVLSGHLRRQVRELAGLRVDAGDEIPLPMETKSRAIDSGLGELLELEKRVILKSVELFSGHDDPLLAQVAVLLRQINLEPGQVLFKKGDRGDCMYIVADGRLKVHDDGHLLNTLGPGDVFGEMALLDSEPRLATVMAVESSRLLRLDQAAFFELMEDRLDFARGILTVLSRRLRDRLQDLSTLRQG